MGTTALLRRVTPYPDGRSDILTVGARRFRLHGVDDSLPYLQAEVEWIPEADGAPDSLAELSASVAARFADYQTLLAGGPDADGDPDETGQLPDDPTVLSYLVSAAMLLDLSDRQRLLAAPTTTDRLARLTTLLAREQTVIGLLGAVPATDLLRAGMTLN